MFTPFQTTGKTAPVNFASLEKILAVIKSIEIIGEAVKLIPQEIRDKNPQVPWKAIAGIRDMLVHEYWGIDINVVWQTIRPLAKVLNKWSGKTRETRGQGDKGEIFGI